jgi:hypothetical protein
VTDHLTPTKRGISSSHAINAGEWCLTAQSFTTPRGGPIHYDPNIHLGRAFGPQPTLDVLCHLTTSEGSKAAYSRRGVRYPKVYPDCAGRRDHYLMRQWITEVKSDWTTYSSPYLDTWMKTHTHEEVMYHQVVRLMCFSPLGTSQDA